MTFYVISLILNITGNLRSIDTTKELEPNQGFSCLSTCITWAIVWGSSYLWGNQAIWTQAGGKRSYESHCKVLKISVFYIIFNLQSFIIKPLDNHRSTLIPRVSWIGCFCYLRNWMIQTIGMMLAAESSCIAFGISI